MFHFIDEEMVFGGVKLFPRLPTYHPTMQELPCKSGAALSSGSLRCCQSWGVIPSKTSWETSFGDWVQIIFPIRLSFLFKIYYYPYDELKEMLMASQEEPIGSYPDSSYQIRTFFVQPPRVLPSTVCALQLRINFSTREILFPQYPWKLFSSPRE